MSKPDPVRDCVKHGKLKRSCPDCATEEEILELRRANAKLRRALENIADGDADPDVIARRALR